jgi:tRNA pseudouridine38-40 synthase
MAAAPQRFRLTVEYIGTHLHGWARTGGVSTVQGILEVGPARGRRALKIPRAGCARQHGQAPGRPVRVCGAGRTDTGVNAIGMVAHVDLQRTNRKTGEVSQRVRALRGATAHPLCSCARVCRPGPAMVYDAGDVHSALGFHLAGKPVQVTHVELVDARFHARHSAVLRSYLYRVLNGPISPLSGGRLYWHVPDPIDVNAMRVRPHSGMARRPSHCWCCV